MRGSLRIASTSASVCHCEWMVTLHLFLLAIRLVAIQPSSVLIVVSVLSR